MAAATNKRLLLLRLLQLLRNKRRKLSLSRRRYSVRPINRKRAEKGEFNLVNDMRKVRFLQDCRLKYA